MPQHHYEVTIILPETPAVSIEWREPPKPLVINMKPRDVVNITLVNED